jgi:hypothetical protein
MDGIGCEIITFSLKLLSLLNLKLREKNFKDDFFSLKNLHDE